MRRPEQGLQRSVMAYLDAVLPPNAWAFHVPNGGGRTKAEGGVLKAMGVRAGIPDLCIIWQGRAYWIELKAGAGRLSDAQARCHERLWECGCPVGLARSIEDVTGLLRAWGLATREARPA